MLSAASICLRFVVPGAAFQVPPVFPRRFPRSGPLSCQTRRIVSVNLSKSQVAQVEEALYSFCKGITAEYTEKAKALKFNLSNNKELREDVLSQAIEPDALVAMKSADLADRAKKSVRETAKAESLQETINNDELKNLKEAAAGLALRKTDAGLAVVDADAEKAKKEAEDSERRQQEEERIRAATAASEKQVLTTVEVKFGVNDEKNYLNSSWEYTRKTAGAENEDSDDDEARKKTELIISSPVLESQTADSQEMEAFEEIDGDVDGEDAVKLIWDGELDFANKKRSFLYPEQERARPLRLRAYSLQDEGELHHPIFPRVQVQGYISLSDMEKYIAAKRKTPDVKMVLAYKLVPRQYSRSQYDTLVEEMKDKKKGMCLIDDRNWGGLLYCLPSTSPSVNSLLSFSEEDCLIAVAITDRAKRDYVPKQNRPEDIRQEVKNDFARATGSTEKTVMLKLKKSSLNLRLRALAGDVALDFVPDELKEEQKGQVGDVIDFLLTQKVSVMEVEPEREQDEEEHCKLIETLVDKKRAAVVLDTEKALMYLVPPIDEAGKLLDPPSTSCDSLLGVLLLSQEDTSAAYEQVQNMDSSAEARVPAEAVALPPTQPQATQPQPAAVLPPDGASAVGISFDNRGNQGSRTNDEDQMLISQRPLAAKGAPDVTAQWSRTPHNQIPARSSVVPPPLSINQAALEGASQSPYDPSPRPSYIALQSPSMPAPAPPAPPAHGAAARSHMQRGPAVGWQDNSVFPMEGRFVGNNHAIPAQGRFAGGGPHHSNQGQPRERERVADPRQWQQNGAGFQNAPNLSPRNLPGYGMPNSLPYNSFEGASHRGGSFGGQMRGPMGPPGGGGHMGRGPPQGRAGPGPQGPMGAQRMPLPPQPNPRYDDGWNQRDPRNFRR